MLLGFLISIGIRACAPHGTIKVSPIDGIEKQPVDRVLWHLGGRMSEGCRVMPYRSPYPREVPHRAVQMVLTMRPESGTEWAAIKMVAASLGVRSAETVRKWVRQAEINIENPSGTGSEDATE